MAGGAVVAAAAAQRQRMQRVLDAFRIRNATTPEAARSLADLGVTPGREVDELTRAGVLRSGRERESWYLDEAAYINYRDARGSGGRRAVLVGILLVLSLALLAFFSAFMARTHR